MDNLWITAGLALSLLVARQAGAQGPLTVPAGPGQQPLCAQFSAKTLDLSLCAGSHVAPANSAAALKLDLPAAVQPQLATATLEVVQLGGGRRALHARVVVSNDGSAWEALAAAPVDGTAAVKLLWSGLTGLVEGELGERKGPLIETRDRSVLIGEQREDIQLCGRPTMLSPRVVVAKDLSLHPAKLQQLSADERKKAPVLNAALEPQPSRAGSPLHALVASSAVGSPQALTDGNPASYWSENRGADGRGEFVVLGAAKALALTSFHLQFRPQGAVAPALGAAPKELWLVTDEQLFHVELPDNGWQASAPSYQVNLPAPVHTRCVALVLEKGYETKKDTQITISELWASTELGQNWASVAAQLDYSDDEARAAAEALPLGGQEAFAATAQLFAKLSVRGQLLALGVLDQAPCSVAAPAYWEASKANLGDDRDLSDRRVARCSSEVSQLLLAELESSKGAQRRALIERLAATAPAVFAEKVPSWLASGTARERAGLREAIASIATVADAEGALRAALRDETLAPAVRLDLLRALGHHAQAFSPEYRDAFRLAAAVPGQFSAQYLLLEPASALVGGDTVATEVLRRSLKDPKEPQLRAEAARRADAKLFESELIAATKDTEVRVRLAAVESLAGRSPAAVVSLLDRLQEDPWPMVRAAAARALLVSPDPRVDHALAAALADESRHVRRPAAYVLGRRGARSEQGALQSSLEEADEDPAVRAAAAVSLGQMCDQEALESLTDYARNLSSPGVTTGELWLGRAALGALADLHPRDLQQRVAPLLSKSTPAEVRRMAREALARPAKCAALVVKAPARKKIKTGKR